MLCWHDEHVFIGGPFDCFCNEGSILFSCGDTMVGSNEGLGTKLGLCGTLFEGSEILLGRGGADFIKLL